MAASEEIEEIGRCTPSECADLPAIPKSLRMALDDASDELWLYNAGKGPEPDFPRQVRANLSAFCEAKMAEEIDEWPSSQYLFPETET